MPTATCNSARHFTTVAEIPDNLQQTAVELVAAINAKCQELLVDPFKLPAKFCHRCGGTDLYLDVSDGLEAEDIVKDPQSGSNLAEHQCKTCQGASFWM